MLEQMKNILYLIVIILGFCIPFIICFFQNKKYKIVSLELFVYSYLFFIIGFVFFAKLFHIILDYDINSLLYLFSNDVNDKLKFLLSGYSFIGGYIGGSLMMIFFSKLIKVKLIHFRFLYLPNLILMYSILKIGCYIKGCCFGIVDIPVQLIESVIAFVCYAIIFLLMKVGKSRNVVIGFSLISFGIPRFLISFIRVYTSNFVLAFIEIFCLCLICCGIINLKLNFKKSK